jgi:CHASE3 domain sensor protein
MLYDEEGRAFVEPPLIPEEQNLMYIVKDYRRMYNEYWKMQKRIRKLQETNTMLSHRCFSQQRLINKMKTLVKDTFKWLNKKKIAPSVQLDKFRKDFEL